MSGVRYNEPVPKHYCKGRAEWRLQLGKSPERLSAHYRLGCDYRTAIATCWEDGGSEPIYLCENHVKELGRSGENCPSVRTITAQSAPRDNPTRSDDRADAPEVVGKWPRDSDSLKAAGILADTKVGRPLKIPSVRSSVRDLTYGNAVKAHVDEAIWNMETGNYEVYWTALRQGRPAMEAAQAAGGQLAVVHRKISDYTLKLEAVLSESRATINVGEAIDKPLERALLDIISEDAMSEGERTLPFSSSALSKNGLNTVCAGM